MFIRKNKGLAAVEFLITLPLLVLVLTIIVEFGTAYIRYNTLSKSVQNAVRYAVRDVYGTATPYAIANINLVKNMVVYGKKNKEDDDLPILNSFAISDVSVSYDNEDADDKYVVVTANYTYQPIFRYLYFGTLSDLTMSSSAVMRTKP
ncbi:TadE/TadG family type IV pilus assembly protein [Vibrio ziniensis]|uniref:Pilus assembly protein n=1 Tax=Vibrio ziniensis TaxID=2711221 RepID=A0A6G7CG08_9VIBR|nr:TadE/TadG family type IV pilus assembly protein [Vibrio ziniensis]QIH40976.1 pilus assembly protein [Vibrio ziniensis]